MKKSVKRVMIVAMTLIDTIHFTDYSTEISFSEPYCENNYENRLFVTDSRIRSLNRPFDDFCSRIPDGRCLTLAPGEEAKNTASLFRILDAAFNLKLDRSGEMIAFGGGVLTDLTGLAASLFKRGCSVVFYPTTLLAMIDASVGGKTGIDYRGLKNMIGTFYPAREVRIDLNFLKTLPENEYRSGLGEAIKTAMLGDRELFDILLRESDAVAAREEGVLREIVSRCVKVKARFVREDFREKGIRAYLNWGHTFAHAFEAVCGLGSLTHGEAVVWGIDKGLKAADLIGRGNAAYAEAFEELVNKYGFAVETPVPDFEGFCEALSQDKKKNGGDLLFVLQSGPCETFRAPLSIEILRKTVPALHV